VEISKEFWMTRRNSSDLVPLLLRSHQGVLGKIAL